MRHCRLMMGLVLAGILVSERAEAGPVEGYRVRVMVEAATRIDWTFALANQSLLRPPAGWLSGDYDSSKQSYEVYVPSRKDARPLLPAIVFISPGNEPSGWKSFEKLCKTRGILFAGPRRAGNDCPPRQRVRLILDVLDDLRCHYPIDPDRTYLAGFSGGGRMACSVAFALPEYFGGVMPICAGSDVREESWLRRRVSDRLSVALLTGDKDFNHGEVTRLRGPYLHAIGIRSKVWVQAGLGHAVPNDKVLQEAFTWLEADLPRRQALARNYPASRMPANVAPDRGEQASALLKEGKARLAKKETLYSGLMQLKGTLERWPDTDAAAEAKKILIQYEEKADRSWEIEDLAEQRRYLLARARALDAYVSGPLDLRYVRQKADMARQAVQLWMQILDDAPDSPAGAEARKRIPALRKLAGE